MRYLLDSVYWTERESLTEVPLDPLGLDQMKEELADRLVPFLTGRTSHVEEAFWALVFLRWASSDSSSESATISKFLRWERCLKLVWVHFRSTAPYEGFPGVQRAGSQSRELNAPSLRFRPLLVNQRTQGLLGAYFRPLQKLEIFETEVLTPSERGRMWTASIPYGPSLRKGDWGDWRSKLMTVRSQNLHIFTRRFQDLLRMKMPLLHMALRRSHWNRKASWARAAKWLGDDAPYALLAEHFGPWANQVREAFDEVVFDRLKGPIKVPSFRWEIPPQLEGPRWEWLRSELRGKPISIDVLAEWHLREYSLRGKTASQLWLVKNGHEFEIHSYRGSRSRTLNSDFRWSNAVSMMLPRGN